MAPESEVLLQKVLDKIDELTNLQVQVGVLTNQMQALVRSNDELTIAIRGNGKPGLVDRVTSLETRVENHPLLCPVKPVVDQLEKEREERAKEQEAAEEEKNDLRRENRKVLVGFVVSVAMLLIQTVVNGWLFLHNLK